MAEVTNVEKSEAPIKSVTLKLSVTEATDVKTFIEEWYRRKPYMPPASANKVHQAIVLALKGKTSQQAKTDLTFDQIFGRGVQVSMANR